MNPLRRRILQAVLYEIGAVMLTAPIVNQAFNAPATSALLLSFCMSSIALSWNYIFNALFEKWESRQPSNTRTLWRRILHGIGFEGGLVLFLVPLLAWWLDISLAKALIAELGFLVMFFVYAVAFTWAFDKLFGLPASARARASSS